jgi:hypothetical protein
MIFLQAIFSAISRSAGKILNAIFGWAVVALFGRTSPRQQTMLSALVGLAAAWPLLLLGIALPKVAALVVAFVPLSKNVPTWIVRLVWIGLAIAVPTVVGVVVAAKAPPGTPPETFIKRVLRGFPITVGIAGSFLLMFVTVPALRLASMARGRQDEHVPLVTSGSAYAEVANMIDAILHRHGLGATRAQPSWWLVGPAWILRKLGGDALRGFMPRQLAYWIGPQLELALYPSDLLIRGEKARMAWAHGLLAEGLARGPGLQTLTPDAQRIEQQIRETWAVLDQDLKHHRHSRMLRSVLRDIAEDLGRVSVPYDEWQVLYRETIQLSRALEGQPQLLDEVARGGNPADARTTEAASQSHAPAPP